ncbi:MAG: S8 family serine peptidase [Roseburia sp.]|nr:S8 family serine peptidase [Roseburia sp.]
MDNQKIENLLNLAMEATPEERVKSMDLNVGFDSERATWQVIVKFFGTESELREVFARAFPNEFSSIKILDLSSKYAILEIPENLVDKVAALPEIEYMEKPKRLFFAVDRGKSASCINPLQIGASAPGQIVTPPGGRTSRNNLTGRGTIVAIVDSGIDYAHPDFRNANGTTRILELWDQTLDTVYDREDINRALEQPTEAERYAVCPSRDSSGHGTHVAGIAAGNGRASNGRYRGVAFESELIVVKLGTPRENALPRTTELMSALDFCVKKSREYGRPIAINLSFGNNYGSHSGTSLLETFIDDMADFGRNVIVIGSGNDGAAALHTAGVVEPNRTSEVQLAVSEFEPTLNVQIWKNYADNMEIALEAPNGTRVGPLQQILGPQRFRIGDTELLIYYGEPKPFNPYQEIYIEFIPVGDYVEGGIWRIQLIPRNIVNGGYDMWLPSGGTLNIGTAFLEPVEETTLTIPSTASKGIAVGAYDARFNQPAAFSGRGFTRETNQVKPDLVAPGVEITSCAVGGGYEARTGTSMATPFVTGSAALMMQWGIVDGNDSYLYGEKIKAYLIRGAKRTIGGFAEWPNPQLGWGTLCLEASLPE